MLIRHKRESQRQTVPDQSVIPYKMSLDIFNRTLASIERSPIVPGFAPAGAGESGRRHRERSSRRVAGSGPK